MSPAPSLNTVSVDLWRVFYMKSLLLPHWDGVRRGSVESGGFHHHPGVMRPPHPDPASAMSQQDEVLNVLITRKKKKVFVTFGDEC